MKKKSTAALLMMPLILSSMLFASAFDDHADKKIDDCGLSRVLPIIHGRARPARPTLSGSPVVRITTNFRTHYTLSGSDATTAQYAESVSVYAETCWARITAMGWLTPPPDQNVGGDNRYDIYIRGLVNMGDSAYYGICWTDSNYSNPYIDGYSSWVEVTKDSVAQPFARYPRLRALVAHEFDHGSQFRYSGWEGPGASPYENTAVFMEDKIFDEVNTLYYRLWAYTPNPLVNTYNPVTDTTGGYEYPGGLWMHFMDEYYGPLTVRRLWERFGQTIGGTTMADINYVLSAYYDSDLYKALSHYAIWRWFCGERDDGLHFEEGSEYPNAWWLRVHTTYPANGSSSSWPPSGPGGCHCIRLSNFGANRVRIFVNGEDGYVWSAYVLGIPNNGIYTEHKIMLEPTVDTGSVSIPGWLYDTLIIIPVVTQWTGSPENLDFNYSATLVTLASDIKEHSRSRRDIGARTSTNPERIPVIISCALPNDAANGKLRIYDISGSIIRSFMVCGESGNDRVVWDGKGTAGEDVPAGVYFLRIDTDNGHAVQKFILMR